MQFLSVFISCTDILYMYQLAWTNTFSTVVIRYFFGYNTCRERTYASFFACLGSALSTTSSIHLLFRTIIEFILCEVPAPVNVLSKLSILSASINDTGELSHFIASSAMTTGISFCSFKTFNACSVSISSIRS